MTGQDAKALTRERLLAAFGGAAAVEEEFTGTAGLAAELEFLAALLRRPGALARYSAGPRGR